MYTEFVFATELKKDTPENVINILKYLTDEPEYDTEYAGELPEHPFFKTDRWKWIFKCDSYYFPGISMCQFVHDEFFPGTYYLTSRSNLKNYDNEIGKFLHWIKPYCDGSHGFMGYKMYEEFDEPTLIYYDNMDTFYNEDETAVTALTPEEDMRITNNILDFIWCKQHGYN